MKTKKHNRNTGKKVIAQISQNILSQNILSQNILSQNIQSQNILRVIKRVNQFVVPQLIHQKIYQTIRAIVLKVY